MKIGLEFQIKRGVIDENYIEEDTKNIIIKTKKLIKEKNFEDAVNYLLPQLKFEWIWSNGDGDPNEFFLSDDDVSFECNKNNCLLKVGLLDNSLMITANVEFYIEGKKNIEINSLKEWLSDNSMYACGYVGLDGWSYSETDGDNVWITSVDGKKINPSND